MYYFEKDFPFTPKTPHRISFDRRWRYFDFRQLLVHKENREIFEKWRKDFWPGLPDFLAAVVAQTHYRNCLDRKFILEALYYCKAMIEELGYERGSLRDLSMAPETVHHVMLVAGCQGPNVRKARVNAAFHVLSRLARLARVTMVFSGRNPAEEGGREYILTPDEAKDMEREFDLLVERDPAFRQHRNFSVKLERKARTSAENLQNFYSGGYLSPSEQTYLYIVSSTFHLRRLAEEAERRMTGSSRISKIVLVGGEEDPVEEPVMLEVYYIKNMFFEVFTHMLKCKNMEIERPGEYEGAV